jgi:hypothetical protein
MKNISNIPKSELVWNLFQASSIALGADGSTPSPIDRKRLFNAIVAIEVAMDEGIFHFHCDDAEFRSSSYLTPAITIDCSHDTDGNIEISNKKDVAYTDRADIEISILSNTNLEEAVNMLRSTASWIEENSTEKFLKFPSLNENQLAHNEFVKDINDDHL